jgi:hypothetical protein
MNPLNDIYDEIRIRMQKVEALVGKLGREPSARIYKRSADVLAFVTRLEFAAGNEFEQATAFLVEEVEDSSVDALFASPKPFDPVDLAATLPPGNLK